MQILSRTKSSLKAENPKVITNLIYLPKKKLFQFSAIVKSGPNAMTAIGDYLSEMVTVLYGEITAIPGQEYSSISYFVEGKKPGITKDSIKAMLASSPMIVSCQVAEGKDGL